MLPKNGHGVNPHDATHSPNGSHDRVELPIGVPVTLRLVYAEPQEGEGRFGKWYRFTVEENGKRKSWFASRYVVKALRQRNAHNGSVLVITRHDKGCYSCVLDGTGFEVNGDVVSDSIPQGEGTKGGHVVIELSTRQISLTLQEMSELADWFMVNGGRVA